MKFSIPGRELYYLQLVISLKTPTFIKTSHPCVCVVPTSYKSLSFCCNNSGRCGFLSECLFSDVVKVSCVWHLVTMRHRSAVLWRILQETETDSFRIWGGRADNESAGLTFETVSYRYSLKTSVLLNIPKIKVR